MSPINTKLLTIFILLITPNTITSDTFENVTLVLKWHPTSTDTQTVTIKSDSSLKRYARDFGEVIIDKQKIPHLGILSISNLPKLNHLHLTNSGLRKIQPGAFSDLPTLTVLNLSGNLLEELEDGIFANLHFQSLYLEGNRIGRIGDNVFTNLKMENLFIDDNRISQWRSHWFLGTPLTSISMSNNFLQKLPRLSFEYLWHLGVDIVLINLTLNNNTLTDIEPGAFEGIKMIVSLNLHNNSLTYLEPGLFDTVDEMDEIDLSGNQLGELYYEVFRKTQISGLNVYDNLLTCVSTDIFNATQLKRLKVDNNPVSCDCVQSWQHWKRKEKYPDISGFHSLENRCKSLAFTVTGRILPLIIIFATTLI